MISTSHGRLSAFRLSRIALRAAAGDDRAFRSLFRALHPVVYGYLAARNHSQADAEDLTAQVFAKVVERLPSYDPRRGTPRAWVLSIARNIFIDWLRSRRHHASLEDVEAELADARFIPEPEPDDRLDRIRIALAAHTPEVREMFALRFGDGLRNKEIAVVMGTTEAAIKQRFSRVLRELRLRVTEPEEEVVHAH